MVTYLNEYPSVILGDFDPAYLALPDEILLTVMRDHQKYFGLESKGGELAPHFLAVINLPSDPKGLVREGHERVLRARFADAQFFWETDQKTRLGDQLPKLKAVTYESRLGSYGDKVERMRALARWLAEQWFSAGVSQADVAGSDRAAELAKCDLVTEMVREFTELQGVVGGLYARAQGEPDEIAWAVYDHYKPVGLDDPLPRNLTGCTVALADKLDSMVAFFAVGAVPTGSSDPFALRRAALGIVKIILERKLPISLSAAISAAAKALKEHAPKIEATEAVQKQVLNFLLERAKFSLREKGGFAYDEINAVFAAGADDLVDAADRVSGGESHSQHEEFRAAGRVVQADSEHFGEIGGRERPGARHGERGPVVGAGREGFACGGASHRRIGTRLKRRTENIEKHLKRFRSCGPAIDAFFDKVLVMVEDKNVRNNRITLLGNC